MKKKPQGVTALPRLTRPPGTGAAPGPCSSAAPPAEGAAGPARASADPGPQSEIPGEGGKG